MVGLFELNFVIYDLSTCLMQLMVDLHSFDVHSLFYIPKFLPKSSYIHLGWSFMFWEKFAENLVFPNQLGKNLQPVGRFWKFHTNLPLPNQLGKNHQPVGLFWKVVLVSVLVQPVGQKPPTGRATLNYYIFILHPPLEHWTHRTSLQPYFGNVWVVQRVGWPFFNESDYFSSKCKVLRWVLNWKYFMDKCEL